VIGSLGAAFGGSRVAISGLKKQVSDHMEHDEKTQGKIANELASYRLETTDRLARIETKLDEALK
jgi:hypothetical protein